MSTTTDKSNIYAYEVTIYISTLSLSPSSSLTSLADGTMLYVFYVYAHAHARIACTFFGQTRSNLNNILVQRPQTNWFFQCARMRGAAQNLRHTCPHSCVFPFQIRPHRERSLAFGDQQARANKSRNLRPHIEPTDGNDNIVNVYVELGNSLETDMSGILCLLNELMYRICALSREQCPATES